MPGILIIFHTPSNAGYAMAPLEKVFYEIACDIIGSPKKVHFAFSDLSSGKPTSLPSEFDNIITIDRSTLQKPHSDKIQKYIKKHDINTAFCFDLQPRSNLCTLLRQSGVSTLFSYWGSTISPINSGLKLWAKKIEVALTRNKPDLFIFESSSMQNFAINGRGIREDNTCVIPTGIDANRFKPNPNAKPYLEKEFSIPTNNKVAFYSGHMEERKGVKVIIEAAIELIDKRNQHDIYFLICGNRPGEEIPFQEMLANTKAKSKVVFGGYRNDLDQIMSGCDVGLLASTGWDSFPMSTLEMASCGLPLVVSSLQGLVETIEDQKTGYLFEPGNSVEMANKIQLIINNETLGKQFSKAGRERILNGYTVEHQKANLKNRLTTTLNA